MSATGVAVTKAEQRHGPAGTYQPDARPHTVLHNSYRRVSRHCALLSITIRTGCWDANSTLQNRDWGRSISPYSHR
jgi:hypothetical protein